MKKIIALCLALILTLSVSPIYAFASDINEESETAFKACGIICDEFGNVVASIPVIPVSSSSVNSLGAGASQTYSFMVPSSIFQNSSSSTGWDAYYCIQGTLTINYNVRDNTGDKEMLLTSAKGDWTTPNDSRVSVNGATLFCNCSGQSYEGGVWTPQTASFNILNSKNTLCYTNFSNYILAVSGMAGAVGAKLTIDLLMGTSRTWSLYIELYAFEV